MGFGNDMLNEAMIDQMVEEELQARANREQLFDTLEWNIRHAKDLDQVKLVVLHMLKHIREKT